MMTIDLYQIGKVCHTTFTDELRKDGLKSLTRLRDPDKVCKDIAGIGSIKVKIRHRSMGYHAACSRYSEKLCSRLFQK